MSVFFIPFTPLVKFLRSQRGLSNVVAERDYFCDRLASVPMMSAGEIAGTGFNYAAAITEGQPCFDTPPLCMISSFGGPSTIRKPARLRSVRDKA